MIDFILALSDMQVAQVQVLRHIPVRTDHRMVPAEVQIKGTYRAAPMGAQLHPARRDTRMSPQSTGNSSGKSMTGGHIKAWSQATMVILVRAVGPPACRTRVRRGAGVRHVDGAQEEMAGTGRVPGAATRVLDRGPQDLSSACGMVRRCCGNVFTPITTVNQEPR